MQTILVVGGGMAAARTCASLRKLGYDATIILISAEDRLPYDRPPLSKAVLHGDVDTTLRIDWAKLDVDVRLGVEALELDPTARVVQTSNGPITYDGLVIASGADAIRLPGDGTQLTLRTADDAALLREQLVPDARVVIIGASWIGAEVATAARARGCQVTCIEAAEAPLANILGVDVGTQMLDWWEGIDLRLGVGVTSIDPGAVRLSDGSEISADVVVVGVGVRAGVGWLVNSGLTLNRGVIVDAYLRTERPEIVALGDVASWWSERSGSYVSVMHWDDAAQAPAIAAHSLLNPGDDGPTHNPVPYFWSDQFGHKLQYVGDHRPEDASTIQHDADGKLAGVCWSRKTGELTAYLAIDNPRAMLRARQAITAGDTIAQFLQPA